MRTKRVEVENALRDGADKVRLFLLHGADTSGSGELAGSIVAAAGPDGERVVLESASLKSDPALLADEAAAFSLFGGKRVIVVEGGGDDLLTAVEGLLAGTAAGNAVIVVAGVLRKGSKLLALAEASPLAMSCVSYVPEGRDAERIVIDMGRAMGLGIAPDIARRVATASAGDRSMMRHELVKFALFLDAAPERPALLEHDVLDALSADSDEGDVSRIVDAVLDGDLAALDRELGQFAGGNEVPLVRALARRALLLAKYRAEVDRGSSISTVLSSTGKSLFYKDKVAVERQVGRWTAARIATLLGYLLGAERNLKAVGSIGGHAVTEPLFAIAQAAAKRR